MVLPTNVTQVKNEDIVYNHVTRVSEFTLSLDYTIKDAVSSQPLQLTWLRDGNPINIPEVSPTDASTMGSKSLYAIVTREGQSATVKLVISHQVAVAGRYTLTAKQNDLTSSGYVDLVSAPELPVYNKPKRVLQGDSMRISCKVAGYPLPDKVDWFFGAVDRAADSDTIPTAFKNALPLKLQEGMTLENENGVPQDTLKFSTLQFDDNGVYVCKAKNDQGQDESAVYLNVKDRWAALWPFIGVVIEVTVLVAAILLFERYQMRAKKTKTDTKLAENNNAQSEKVTAPKEEETPLAQSLNHVNEK
ncbi:hypothetical protein Ciccas_004170 [Cichlidogyrus casuarinus]|uniref:Ig-like domain-containing protein n=1 Tax=Cichlidogyrus casuarinus TaxID=1844966 RepID=A0ABD2QCB0_9PLAT